MIEMDVGRTYEIRRSSFCKECGVEHREGCHYMRVRGSVAIFSAAFVQVRVPLITLPNMSHIVPELVVLGANSLQLKCARAHQSALRDAIFVHRRLLKSVKLRDLNTVRRHFATAWGSHPWSWATARVHVFQKRVMQSSSVPKSEHHLPTAGKRRIL